MAQAETEADREVLVEWVARYADPARKPPALMFGLNRAAGFERSDPITNYPFPQKKGVEDRRLEAERAVDEFLREARVWASTEARPQRFTISAHVTTYEQGAPPPQAFAQTAFVVTPPPGVGGADGLDPRDSLGAMQRLASDHARHYAANMQQCMDRLSEDNKELRSSFRLLSEQNLAFVLEREKNLSEKNRRDIEVEESRVRLDAMRRGFDLLAAWLTQRAGLAPAAVTSEQLLAFAGSLSQEQRVAFLPIMRAVVGAMPREEQDRFRAALEQGQQAARPVAINATAAAAPANGAGGQA